jgi:hypothetical protein
LRKLISAHALTLHLGCEVAAGEDFHQMKDLFDFDIPPPLVAASQNAYLAAHRS